MLSTHGGLHIISIASNVMSAKRKIVINKFGKYLISYYYAEYSQNSLMKNLHKNKLTNELPQFILKNPLDWDCIGTPLSSPPI